MVYDKEFSVIIDENISESESLCDEFSANGFFACKSHSDPFSIQHDALEKKPDILLISTETKGFFEMAKHLLSLDSPPLIYAVTPVEKLSELYAVCDEKIRIIPEIGISKIIPRFRHDAESRIEANVDLSSQKSLDEYISDALINLCITPDYTGFYILEDVIHIALSEPQQSFTKIICPKLAKKYETTPIMIERNIHHVITICWSSARPEDKLRYLGAYGENTVSTPTTVKFVRVFVEMLGRKKFS